MRRRSKALHSLANIARLIRPGPVLVLLALTHLPSETIASTLQAAPPAPPSPSLLSTPPRSWIPDVAANEIRAIQKRDPSLRYRVRTVDAKGDRTREMVESKDGTVARLLLKDGKPITREEDDAERDRLNSMIASPSEFTKHAHSDMSGKKLAVDLIQLMPDAMLFTYAPGQPQLSKASQSPQIVIDYTPNPDWSPPNITAEALTGLRGRMWIDPETRHLLRMEGTVFQGVNFGWGMLAHIYPGGKLTLDQVNATGDRWIFSHFSEQVKVRALLLKSVNIDTTIDASGFQPLPGPVTYQQAIRLLLQTPLAAR